MNRLQILVVMVWKPAGIARIAGEPNNVIACRKATSAPAGSGGTPRGLVMRRPVAPGRATEKIVELFIGHAQAGAIVEIRLIEAKAAVVFQVDQVIKD